MNSTMIINLLLSFAPTCTDELSYYDSANEISISQTLAFSGTHLFSIQLDRFGRACPDGITFITTEDYIDGIKSEVGNIRKRYRLFVPLKYNKTTVYEYLSYRLIRGEILFSGLGQARFIPSIGSKIITLDTYLKSDKVAFDRWVGFGNLERPRQTPQAISIYNLPGFITPSQNPIKKSVLADFPFQPAPEDAIHSENKFTLKFITSATDRFALRFSDDIFTCTLDPESGEIIYEDTRKRIKAAANPRPLLPPWLMEPRKLNESVYELQSGRLIPGFLHELAKEEWLFVPDIGGTIIDANEYLKTYQPWSRRIYNLPGKFVPKMEK